MMALSTLTREQSRDVDRRAIADYGMCGLVLMENAGRGCVDVMTRIGIHGPVVISCGKGNNGGDGFVIARHLDLRGYAVRVAVCCDPAQLEGDAEVNHRIAARAGISMTPVPSNVSPQDLQNLFAGADWIVDALLGTGSSGEPRAPMDVVIDAMNAANGKKMAIDLPSGLDCNRGEPAKHTFRADHTCTFVCRKRGFLENAAASWLGEVHVIDIGVPRKLVDEILHEINK